MKFKDMNKHQQLAVRACKQEFNYVVGGYYNSYQDGYEDEIPSLEEAKKLIYDMVVGNYPKEVKFAGSDFCKKIINQMFAKDEDAREIWNNEAKEVETMAKKNVTREQVAQWTTKEMREHLKAAGFTGISKTKKEDLIEMILTHKSNKKDSGNTVEISKVNMFAFTGMLIGEFEAEVQGDKILVYTESKGELMFDLETGKEVTDKNKARYANRVEAV